MGHKIIFVIASLNRGGTELRLLDVMRGLDRARFEPALFVAKGGGELLAETGDLPVVVGSAGRRVLGGIPPLWRLLRREQPRVVWCLQNGLTSAAGQLFAGALRRQVIVLSLHGRTEGRPALDRITRLASSLAGSHIVTVSQQYRRWLLDEGVPDSRITVLYNGVDTNRFQPAADRAAVRQRLLGIEPDRPVIGTVGNLLPVKAQDVLLRAAALVTAQFPQAVFALAGDGPQRQPLERLSRELGLEANVRFLGRRLDVPDLLQTFDIFALTSNSEGLPNAVLEAMACGLPVVCTGVGGAPELVTPETGFLVPPRDAEALADALLQLLHDPAARRMMGQAARRRALEHFSLEAMLRGRELFLARLLEESGSLPAKPA